MGDVRLGGPCVCFKQRRKAAMHRDGYRGEGNKFRRAGSERGPE